jgi:8-oxo-dGTP diphosphatase
MGAYEQGADAITGRWLTISRTLSFVTNGNDLLLMKRDLKRRVFPGLYNGLGGHIERGEDPYTSALREIREESGLIVQNLQLCGVYQIDAKQATGITLFVFTAESLSRTVSECDEGTLHWIPLADVYKLPLVEDLPIVLPRLFQPTITLPFFAHVHYDEADRLVMHFAEGV